MSQDHYEEEPQEEASSESPSTGRIEPVNVAGKGWKSGFALSKFAPMPAKNWKKSAGLITHSEMPGRLPKEKKERKPIKQISDAKAERIRTEGSEMDFFKQIVIDRSIDGYVMATDLFGKKKKIALEDLTVVNFAHIKGKGMNKASRLDPDNVKIVTFAVHFREHTGQNYKGPLLPN